MDLVERLRRNAESMARSINPPNLGSDPLHYLDGRAAAEIERLRAALKDIEFIVDGKADADDGIPNDAMRIESVIKTALRGTP